MTVQIKCPGATFTNFVTKLGLPFIEDAVFYGLFGGDAATSVANRIEGGVDATLIGAPGFAANHALLSGDNAILAPDVVQPMTFLMAVRAPAGAFPHFGMIDFDNGVTGLLQHSNADPGKTKLTGNGNTDVNLIAGEIVGPNDFSLMAFSYDGATAVQRLYNGDLAPHTVSTPYAANVGSVAARIGGYNLVGGNPFHCAAAAFYDRALSIAEIDEVHDYWQALLPVRGVTLL